jgi:polysaccharide biosynthesis transport protein
MSVGDPPAPGRDSDTLAHALGVMRRRWLVIALCVLACVVVAVGQQASSTDRYTATANVAFGTSGLSTAALQVDVGSDNPEREAATNVLVAQSPEVAEAVIRQLGLPMSPSDLLDAVQVAAAANANVLDISADAEDPETAARVANAFADEYIDFQAQTQLNGIASAERDLTAQMQTLPIGSPEREAVEASLQRLAQLRAVANGDARVIGRASSPDEPSGLGLRTTALLGAIIGLAIGLTVAFVLEAIDRRVETIEDFEREYRLQALAAVPQAAFRRRRAVDRRGQLEPYRILRSALDFAAVTRTLDSILVTSAMPGEGKTTVAVDLAQAIALAGRRVTLIELDLRRPTFSQHFELDAREGVTTALLDPSRSPRDLIVAPLPDVPDLGVLPAGELPPNPSELLSSQALLDLLAELNDGETTLVIDAPPLNPVADAQELLSNPNVHGALIVARERKTTRDQVRQARAILDRHMVQLLGIVVTGIRDERRYGYGVRPREEELGPLDRVVETPVPPRRARRRSRS